MMCVRCIGEAWSASRAYYNVLLNEFMIYDEV